MTNPQPLPAKYPFKLYRGDTRVWEHHFTEDDGVTPLDITGWVFLSQYRATTEDATVEAADVCVITDAAGGVMRRTLTAAAAAGIQPDTVAWDLQATKADATVKTYLYNDAVKVSGDVSRA